MNQLKKGVKILLLATITCLLGGYLYTSADAQLDPGQRGGPAGIDPEEMERVWVLQADSAGAALGLDEAAGDKLAEAYLKARQGLQEKMREARESGGGWEGMREMRQEAVTSLGADLEAALGPDSATKSMEILGGFSFRADMAANLLSQKVEDPAKLHSAVVIVLKHENRQPGRPPQGGGEDRAARAEKMYNDLGTVLTAEQLQEFKTAMEQFRRPGRSGGPGPEGRRPRD